MGKSLTKKERKILRHIDNKTGKPRGYSESVSTISPGIRNAMLRIARKDRRYVD